MPTHLPSFRFLSAGSISNRTRQENWTLDQVGNCDLNQVDLNGDVDFVDANELNDDRTHNVVNELTARDTDDNGSDNYTLTYDAVGNLTNDGHASRLALFQGQLGDVLLYPTIMARRYGRAMNASGMYANGISD